MAGTYRRIGARQPQRGENEAQRSGLDTTTPGAYIGKLEGE